MKRILFVLIMLVNITLQASAQDLGKYRIPDYNTVENYQNLIGKQFTYVPQKGRYGLARWCDFGFEPLIVKIKSVEGKTKKGKSSQKMKWVIEDMDGKESSMTIYSGTPDKTIWSYKDEYKVSEIPIFDMEQWKKDNADKIGMVFSDPRAKATYTVSDIKYGEGSSLTDKEMVFLYVVKNSITGVTKEVEAKHAQEQCFKKDLEGKYVATLSKVEKPDNPNLRYGKTTTVEDKGKGITKFGYTDSQIDIFLYVSQSQFNFELKNVSPTTQKLIWNEAVFVDIDGTTSKVMHAGTKYSQRDEDQPASTIIKGAKLDDIACPTKNVRYSDIIHEWVTDPILPRTHKDDELPSIRLMLPIQVKDVINEYIFEFKVNWVYNHPELVNL